MTENLHRCFSQFTTISLSLSPPAPPLNVNKPSWAVGSSASSSCNGSAHRMSRQPIGNQLGSQHCHNDRQAGRQESVVVRVPLWSSGLVTLAWQPSMHCKSVWLAPNRLTGRACHKTQYIWVCFGGKISSSSAIMSYFTYMYPSCKWFNFYF